MPTPWENWDGDLASLPCFVINLKSSTERWAIIQRDVAPLLPRLQRVDAVDARVQADDLLTNAALVSVATRERITNGTPRWEHDSISTIGAVGCALSHVKVWQAIVRSKAPLALVLEDNMNLHAGHLGRIKRIVAHEGHALPPSAVWFLGNVTRSSYAADSSTRWRVPTLHFGTVAYLITQQAATTLLQQALPIEMHVDHFMTKVGNLNLVATRVHPDVSVTRNWSLASDINHDVPRSVIFVTATASLTFLLVVLVVVVVMQAVKLHQLRRRASAPR